MLIENLTVVENNGIVTSTFTTGSLRVTVSVDLQKIVDYASKRILGKSPVDHKKWTVNNLTETTRLFLTAGFKEAA